MGSRLFSIISTRFVTCDVRSTSLTFEMQKRSTSPGGHILWRSHILKTKPHDRSQCTRQSHTLMSDTNSPQPQAQPVLWNANLPQMISHFLGFSQTLILKRGHKGGTFSKILRNSHWISPESGFSPQDALTPFSLKLWGKSMFATQEGGRGFFHICGIQVCAKLCSLRRFITEPGKRIRISI